MSTPVLICLMICILFISIFVISGVSAILKHKNNDLIIFLRDYKKLRFMYIYIALFAMHLANVFECVERHVNNIEKFEFAGLLQALKSTVEGAVLKFDYSHFSLIYENYEVWKWIIYVLFVLVFINAILVVCSLFYIQAWKFIKLVSVKFKKENVVIIGYNKNSKKLISSIDKKKYSVVVVDNFDGSYDELISLNTAFIDTDVEQGMNIRKVVYTLLKKYKGEPSYFIINTKNEKTNIIITNEISKIIDSEEDRKSEILKDYGQLLDERYYQEKGKKVKKEMPEEYSAIKALKEKEEKVKKYEDKVKKYNEKVSILEQNKDKKSKFGLYLVNTFNKIEKSILDKQKINLIDDEKKNIIRLEKEIREKLGSVFEKMDEDYKEIRKDKIYRKEIKIKTYNMQAYVFGTEENESAFTRFEQLSKGRVKYINRHRYIAYNFIERYPLTRFMDEHHIDRKTATLNKDVDINVYLVGYGCTNQQILLASVANNQFLTIKEDDKGNKKLESKLVNYYVYNNSENLGKNMIHQYHRFQYEVGYYVGREDEFFDDPINVKPAETVLNSSVDINSEGFYNKLQQDVKNAKREDINYIIISIGNDIENIDFAEKISSKISEWDVSGNTYLFVRISDSSIEEKYLQQKNNDTEKKEYHSDLEINGVLLQRVKEPKNQTDSRKNKYYFFGEEDRIVFNFNSLIKQELYNAAIKRHTSYSIENVHTDKYESYTDEQRAEKDWDIDVYKQKREQYYLEKSWYEMSQIQRDSNLFSILSIRTKLNLLGYDLVKPDTLDDYSDKGSKKKRKTDTLDVKDEVKFEDFYNDYFKGSNNELLFQYKYKKGKKEEIVKNIYKQVLEYPDCKRTNMAIQEHQRWTAFMLCMGMIPSTMKEVIENLNDGKDYAVKRKHGCITTFEGLIKHRYIMAVKAFIVEKAAEKMKGMPEYMHILDEKELKKEARAFCNDFFKYKFEVCIEKFEELSEKDKNKFIKKGDTIKHDFKVIDDLEFFFYLCNYKIVRKFPVNENEK